MRIRVVAGLDALDDVDEGGRLDVAARALVVVGCCGASVAPEAISSLCSTLAGSGEGSLITMMRRMPRTSHANAVPPPMPHVHIAREDMEAEGAAKGAAVRGLP